ncbi:MAG: ELWxxDGT repeat protein, partial [Bacteroidota bacterium]
EPLVIPLPQGTRRRYDEGNFFFFREQLYLQTGAARSVEGDDLFRADTALTGVFYTPEIETFGFISDNFQPAVTADSLFFLARTRYDTATLYAYTGTMASPRPIFSLFSTGEGLFGDPIWTEITEEYLYLAVLNDDKLYRRNRLSGRIEAVDVSFGVWDPNTTVSPLSLLNGDLYFLHQGNAAFPTPGLYRWRADAEQPRVLGDFALPFAFPRPVPWGNSVIRTDSLFRLRVETETLVGIPAPMGIRENSLRLLGAYGKRTLVNGRTLPDQQQRLLRLGEDSFVDYPVFLADTLVLVDNNLLTDVRRLNDSTFTALLRVINDNVLLAVLGRLFPTKIELSALQAFTPTRSRQLFAADEKVVLNLGRPGASGQEIFVYDRTGAELSNVLTERDGLVRGISATGFFVEEAPGFSFRLFSAPDTPFRMPYAGVSPVPNATNFYVLANKLLFVADAPATGREWYVARPEIGRIVPLRDIHPGPAFGTNYTTGFQLGDRLLLTANDGVHGAEPWITDGTSAGTRLVADLNPGPGSSNPFAYTLVDTSLYFTANGPNGYEAYRTGVEVLRPELFVDLYPGPESGHPYGYTLLDGRLYLYGCPLSGPG